MDIDGCENCNGYADRAAATRTLARASSRPWQPWDAVTTDVATIDQPDTSTGFVPMFGPSPQVDHLAQLMTAAELRQKVISQNLANVNTPGYQRLDVEFEAQLADMLKSPGRAAASLPVPQVVQEQGLPNRADGNNVDIDREIGQLNKNSLSFEAYSQILASHFDAMRRATRGP